MCLTRSGGTRSADQFWARLVGGARSERNSAGVRVCAHSASLMTGKSSNARLPPIASSLRKIVAASSAISSPGVVMVTDR